MTYNTAHPEKNSAIALCPAIGDIDSYIRWTQSIGRLSREEEQDLFHRYQQGDTSSARAFILAHLRFVVFITRNYQGYGLSQADLIQEGNIGLLKAFKRFDPSVGVRFVSFAVYWIKSEIQEFVLKNWRIVKIATTKAQRKLFFKMRSFLKKSLGDMSAQEAHHISQTLEVSEKEVWGMQEKLHGNDYSYDLTQEYQEETPGPKASQKMILSTVGNQETLEQSFETTQDLSNQKRHLQAALSTLDARSAEIIQARWFDVPKKTLQFLSEKYDVSAERIRQLETSALKKMRTMLSERVPH